MLEFFRGESVTQGPIKIFTYPSEPIKHSCIQAYQSKFCKLLINQYAAIKYERSTHNTMIYVETQFSKNHQ